MNLSEICKEAGVHSKHLKKTKEVYAEVNKYLRGKPIVDLCCGNGLAGWYPLINGYTKSVMAIDKNRSRGHRRLSEIILKEYPEVTENYKFIEKDIMESEIEMPENSFVVGIHTCGNLVDRIIELSLQKRLPFAVVPCCYRPDRQMLQPEQYELEKNKTREEIIDNQRIKYILEAGRKVEIITLGNMPTPMNLMIMSLV